MKIAQDLAILSQYAFLDYLVDCVIHLEQLREEKDGIILPGATDERGTHEAPRVQIRRLVQASPIA
jgi:hypothetical protein